MRLLLTPLFKSGAVMKAALLIVFLAWMVCFGQPVSAKELKIKEAATAEKTEVNKNPTEGLTLNEQLYHEFKIGFDRHFRETSMDSLENAYYVTRRFKNGTRETPENSHYLTRERKIFLTNRLLKPGQSLELLSRNCQLKVFETEVVGKRTYVSEKGEEIHLPSYLTRYYFMPERTRHMIKATSKNEKYVVIFSYSFSASGRYVLRDLDNEQVLIEVPKRYLRVFPIRFYTGVYDFMQMSCMWHLDLVDTYISGYLDEIADTYRFKMDPRLSFKTPRYIPSEDCDPDIVVSYWMFNCFTTKEEENEWYRSRLKGIPDEKANFVYLPQSYQVGRWNRIYMKPGFSEERITVSNPIQMELAINLPYEYKQYFEDLEHCRTFFDSYIGFPFGVLLHREHFREPYHNEVFLDTLDDNEKMRLTCRKNGFAITKAGMSYYFYEHLMRQIIKH